MKTNRLPRWAERFFPGGMSRCVYIMEDSIVDPINRSLTTYTWNLNHTTLMVRPHSLWKAKQREKHLLHLNEFGLARFKSNQLKAMKGLEYALSNLQGMFELQMGERGSGTAH
ncbi:hypothetical protein GOODEAATRI_002956 [Goodea atripinnis]|uniref:PRELI/MSF1 domain-containing protein n=1 Tax=Goodea atripinnis TaxID=208336 RepID=A0ABV0NIK2_9TELE